MKDEKITLKEFVRATPRLVSLFAWAFLLYCVLAGVSVLIVLILSLLCICGLFYFLPDYASSGITYLSEWINTHGSFLNTVGIIIFLVGLVAFVRKVTIAQAKEIQKGEVR